MLEKETNVQAEVEATNETSVNEEEMVDTSIETEEAGDETTPTANEAELEALQARIAQLEESLEEKENRYLRLQADFENSRRRARLDSEAMQKYRAQSLITDILPVLDNFERALKVETDHEQMKSLLQGMDMIYRSLIEALNKEGVTVVEAVGKEFDPQFHQAVMQVSEEGFASNMVVEEFQKGYMLKDRIIRPSMVKVNQ